MEYTPRTVQIDTSVNDRVDHEAEVQGNYDMNGIDFGTVEGLDKFKIAEFFGTDLQDYRSMDKIVSIQDTFREMGLYGADALMALRGFEDRFRETPIGMKRLDNFMIALKLFKKSNEISKEITAYER